MAVTVVLIIPAKLAEDAQTAQYTSSNAVTVIDKFTGTNTSANNETISVNIVPSGGTAADENLIVDTRTIAPQETYTFPELVGHALVNGSSISTISSSATAIVIRATGRVIT